ncbi:hypothetical protein SADUNF_Sadunf16G0254900 [Salix dunnii]|uniref:Uncharacterized protein n=1 Tax=Salix dunnii TaxID=1413687 RepID=A0A835JE39_9ROSI|nr:hypothetical protein SADUNF_Sadunf16G0254900 [Salix dunnii]
MKSSMLHYKTMPKVSQRAHKLECGRLDIEFQSISERKKPLHYGFHVSGGWLYAKVDLHPHATYQAMLPAASAGSNPGVSHGGGPKINRGSKPKDAANTPKEKLTSGDSGKENKKISEEKVVDDTTMNNKANA